MQTNPPKLETIIKQKKARRITQRLLQFAAIGLVCASLGDYASINNRFLQHAHLFSGIRDARFSANPFDYEISYRITDSRERIAYVRNIHSGKEFRLYHNGKTEPGSKIVDILTQQIKEDYMWLQSTDAARYVAEMKKRVIALFSEDD